LSQEDSRGETIRECGGRREGLWTVALYFCCFSGCTLPGCSKRVKGKRERKGEGGLSSSSSLSIDSEHWRRLAVTTGSTDRLLHPLSALASLKLAFRDFLLLVISRKHFLSSDSVGQAQVRFTVLITPQEHSNSFPLPQKTPSSPYLLFLRSTLSFTSLSSRSHRRPPSLPSQL
jgi:hypothetical protein